MGKLMPSAPPADPLREALADAIAARNEAKEFSLAAQAAVRRAQANVDAARSRLHQATEAVQQARERHALVLADAARDDKTAPNEKTLRAARSEAEIAADDLEAAEQAVLALIEAHTDTGTTLQRVEQALDDAADVVLATKAQDLLTDAEALAKTLAAKIVALHFLRDVLSRTASARRRSIIASHATADALKLLNADPNDLTGDALGKSIERFAAKHESPDIWEWRTHPDVEPWQRAREALKLDADAELPQP